MNIQLDLFCVNCANPRDALARFEYGSYYVSDSSAARQAASEEPLHLRTPDSAALTIDSIGGMPSQTRLAAPDTQTTSLPSIENSRALEVDYSMETLNLWACHICTSGPYKIEYQTCTDCSHLFCHLCMRATTEVSDCMVEESAKAAENELRACARPQKPFLHSPRAYFGNLRVFRIDIYTRSLLARFIDSRRTELPLPFPNNSVKLRVSWQESFTEAEIQSIHNEASVNPLPQPSMGREANQERIKHRVVECRNALFNVCRSLRGLKMTGLLKAYLSVLVLDNSRPTTVNMATIKSETIYDLAQVFHKSVGYMEARHSRPLAVEVILAILTTACSRIMQMLSLCKHSQPVSGVVPIASLAEFDHLSYWRNTVRVLDLAVMSYTGAHIDDIVGLKLEEYQELHIQDNDFGSNWLLGIQLQRRRLQCLSDALNNSDIWVFNLEGVTTLSGASYLATTIQTLEDIWGPVWRQAGDGQTASYFNMGGGSIVPWSPDSGQHPQLNLGERLAHWVPYRLSDYSSPSEGPTPRQGQPSASNTHEQDVVDGMPLHDIRGSSFVPLHDMDISDLRGSPFLTDYPGSSEAVSLKSESMESDSSEAVSLSSESIESESDEETLYENAAAKAVLQYAEAHPFGTDDSLLIGASLKLQKSKCHCSVKTYMHNLKQTQCLHPLETSKLFHYVDGRVFNMSVGYGGSNLGAGIALKRQDGRMWKQALLEIWENQPNARHPKTLEHFWGILVSKCSSNSRRTRLTELLGTDSIHQMLKPFPWSKDEVKMAFLKATTSKNPFALGELWDNEKEWQEELGRVLLACLRALSQTGFDSSRNEFYALWMSSKSTRAKRVVLKPSEHSWVQILQDTEEACGLAVVIKDCLEATYPGGRDRKCSGTHYGPSCLETSVVINHQIEPCKDLLRTTWTQGSDSALEKWRSADRNWKYLWDVSHLKGDAVFWIVPRSRLKLFKIFSNTHLLLKHDLVRRDAFRRMIGAPVGERHGHWEYTEDDDEESPPVRPIPVHVQAW